MEAYRAVSGACNAVTQPTEHEELGACRECWAHATGSQAPQRGSSSGCCHAQGSSDRPLSQSLSAAPLEGCCQPCTVGQILSEDSWLHKQLLIDLQPLYRFEGILSFTSCSTYRPSAWPLPYGLSSAVPASSRWPCTGSTDTYAIPSTFEHSVQGTQLRPSDAGAASLLQLTARCRPDCQGINSLQTAYSSRESTRDLLCVVAQRSGQRLAFSSGGACCQICPWSSPGCRPPQTSPCPSPASGAPWQPPCSPSGTPSPPASGPSEPTSPAARTQASGCDPQQHHHLRHELLLARLSGALAACFLPSVACLKTRTT